MALLLPALLAAPAASAQQSGNWRTQDRSSVIAMAPCAEGWCGRIVGVTLDHPTDPPPVDNHGRLQCGQTIIRMRRRTPDGRWHGSILDPRTGGLWSAQVWLANGTLHLRGFIGLPLFGATQSWTRYAGPLPNDCILRPGAPG